MPTTRSIKFSSLAAVIVAICFAFASSTAFAQWVTIARKSMGAIHNIQNEHADIATVLLEAPADKVYSTAIKAINVAKKVKLGKSDEASRTVSFSEGRRLVTLKVSRVDESLSMLTVTAAGSVAGMGNASGVVGHVLDVCREMGVSCYLPKE